MITKICLLVLIVGPLSLLAAYQEDYVKHLPLYGSAKVTQYAGFATVNKTTDSNIFYYFFETSSASKDAPLTLWLNGGPGASSMLGLFCENGPYRITPNGTLEDNPHSWHQYSRMIYIDQPVGTGYSYTMSPKGYPTTEEQVASDMYTALQVFFTRHPEYQKLDFYITGESYAGKYIPSLGTFIYKKNLLIDQKLDQENAKINLKGLAIGNGWVHPIVQNQAYVNYPYNLGLIDSRQRDEAEWIQNKLVEAIKQGEWDKANDLSNNLEAYVLAAAGNPDIDNVLYASDPLNPLIAALNTYLNTPAVRQSLNVGNSPWNFVNDTTGNALNADEQKSVLHLLPNLIANYRVLIYTGNLDINCNLVGVESYLDEMNWPYKEQFYIAFRGQWKVDGDLAGYARPFGDLSGPSLTNVIVRNAGHEVPFFQPKNALDMFRRFITGSKWF